MNATPHTTHPAAGGGKWIRQERRLAIELRDGMACCWCGAGVEDGVILTMDHCRPHSHGGGNHSENLITACKRCNSSRGDRSLSAFARAVAEYLNHGVTAEAILAHISRCRRRSLAPHLREAKALLARRGTLTAARKAARS